MRILFVEDNASIARAYHRVATARGWDASFAVGVQEAAALLDVEYDVVVLDHEIVGGTGEDVFRLLQERGSKANTSPPTPLPRGNSPGGRTGAKAVGCRCSPRGSNHDALLGRAHHDREPQPVR